MPKFTWIETFTTTAKYSTEITEEESKLFEENPEQFFETVDYQGYKDLEWDEISEEDEMDHEIE